LNRRQFTVRSAVLSGLTVLAPGFARQALADSNTPAGKGRAGNLDCVLNIPEFVEDWKQSRRFTLEVANAMPAELWVFKPNAEEMSFGEQMLHLAGSNVIRFHQITNIEAPFDYDPAKPLTPEKQPGVRMLEESFDYVIRVLPQITPEELKRTWHVPSWQGRTDPDGRAMLLNMFVHTAHHRAQCEVYLRIKGIKPPTYRF
jgi:uncharacterized damage-inducible protein DinB